MGSAPRPNPAAVAQHVRTAKALFDTGRLAEAERLYRELLKHDRNNFDALMGLGAVCRERSAFDEAATLYRKALNQRAGSADAHADLGVSLGALGRVDEAIGRFENALRLRPDDFRSLCNLGSLLAMRNRLDEAIACFDRAIAVNPAEPFPRWHRALALLALGRFEQGWQDYAARPRPPSVPSGAPQWQGEPDLAGKTLLLRAEQGMGDMIQFVRYAPQITLMGARVIVEAHPPLIPLLATAKGVHSVHPLGAALPPHDLHCYDMSLPGLFRAGAAPIPPAPYLEARPEIADAWRVRLGDATRQRIGLVWSGNKQHPNDRNRSMPLAALRPLLESGRAEFVVLQKDITDEDRRLLAGRARIVADDLHDFAETAGAVSACDLVIAIDTSVAHVAGALGRPVWMLLAFAPDWRWMLDRADTPWYPTARLFRQPGPGDWDGAVRQVLAALPA